LIEHSDSGDVTPAMSPMSSSPTTVISVGACHGRYLPALSVLIALGFDRCNAKLRFLTLGGIA
jgi:hypothetical protein